VSKQKRNADGIPDEAQGTGRDCIGPSAGERLRQMQDLLARYRWLDPAERPPDAERVHATFELIPWFTPGSEG
jgi:hypothetical protein